MADAWIVPTVRIYTDKFVPFARFRASTTLDAYVPSCLRLRIGHGKRQQPRWLLPLPRTICGLLSL